MTKKGTKRALLISVVSLLVCFTMLLGTTYAWFTDSVTSAGNIIKTGTLEVGMYWKNTTETDWKDASEGAIFNYDKWEPGYTAVKHVKIENEGTLDFKFMLNIIPEATAVDVNLADVIEVYMVKDAVQITRDMLTTESTSYVGTLSQIMSDPDGAAYGVLYAEKNADPNNGKNQSEIYTIALKMSESAGNEYQNKTVGGNFKVQLVATQLASESDDINDQYDVNATYPLGSPITVSGTVGEYNIHVEIPADAPDGEYELDISDTSVTNSNGTTTLSFDMNLTRDDESASNSGVDYEVTVGLPHPFIDTNSVVVKHNSEVVDGAVYDPNELTVTFTTDSFSPFSIEYTDYIDPTSDLKYEETDSGYIITSGTFIGKNPADFDASLKVADSEYIAVSYVKDGVTYYTVSERATTVIVAADGAANYVNVNGNYTVTTNSSGKLWSIISGLQNNEHSTVYLLPGTYNEGTTIYVYSSMDIIGLGNKEDIKVVKTSSSNSNRHLFNATGTKSEYIEVTIRNMTLDATTKTVGGKDNAAVQSIRKSKVKCYDLDIIKGTGWDAVAFYVNGNNAVDGVKYPAYLYVENCALNTTRTFGIVSTAGSYKFYHSGLTYNNGTAYENNSGSIKNQKLEANDWIWD